MHACGLLILLQLLYWLVTLQLSSRMSILLFWRKNCLTKKVSGRTVLLLTRAPLLIIFGISICTGLCKTRNKVLCLGGALISKKYSTSIHVWVIIVVCKQVRRSGIEALILVLPAWVGGCTVCYDHAKNNPVPWEYNATYNEYHSQCLCRQVPLYSLCSLLSQGLVIKGMWQIIHCA